MQKQLDCHHGSLRARVYFAWVNAWLADFNDPNPGSLKAELTMNELARLFQEGSLLELLNSNKLRQAVQSFHHYHRDGHITLGGHHPPSCDETNILSEKYNPQSDCSCNGIYPVPSNIDDQADMCLTECNAIRNTLNAMQNVIDRPDEWNGASLFSAERLEHAVYELALANDDIQPVPDTCQGLGMAAVIPAIRAPDRRPHPHNDTTTAVNNQIYPTAEQIKLCADAKYFFAIAAGASRCDEGILHAVADSGNDILIGDYCEAADSATLSLLQRVGGAAVAFLKLCTLAGVVPGWLFENLATSIIQFRVLGFYRDHSRGRLPSGIYGSRMTGITVHRHIDVAIFHGVMPAALATGQQLSEKEYLRIAEVCTLINDLIDFRSDIMRKQRENVVLRGIRGCLCNYLDGLLGRLLDTTTEVLQAGTLGSQVIMSFCNWAVLGSHHKLYELMSRVQEVQEYSACEYSSITNRTHYDQVLKALASYGTLGDDGPQISKKRNEMANLYHICRTSEETHMAWLADVTRSLLQPKTMRRIVDVVHFEWNGHVGDANYCP